MTEDDEAYLEAAATLARVQGLGLWSDEKLTQLAEQSLLDCIAALYCLPEGARKGLANDLAARLAAVSSPA